MVFGCFSKITVEMSMFRKIRHPTKSSEIVRCSFLNLNLYTEKEKYIPIENSRISKKKSTVGFMYLPVEI